MRGPIKVRRLPEMAEAYKFTGLNGARIAEWGGRDASFDGGRLVIHTPQGDMTPSPGEYVIRGLVGELYPILPEAFEAGWEVVS